MSKFNTTKVGTKTTNLAGGTAFKESKKLELASLLITSFLAGDKAYETEAALKQRLTNLYKSLHEEDKTFFAKAAIYARDKFRLRSISHLCSAIIAEGVVTDKYTTEDKKWIENYFSKVIMRADDITETISAYSTRRNAYKSKAGRIQLPNVMKRGLSRAVANYDSYIFAKYKQSNKELSLLDAMVMAHAKPTEKNKAGLEALMNKTLKNTSTWEAKQSAVGQANVSTEEKAELKKDAWKEFLDKGDKVEYFALLRNLRNIIETGDETLIDKACELLATPKLVAKSKVLPFRFVTAYNEINNKKVVQALNRAVSLSLSNVPEFTGKTAVILDTSGSMGTKANTSGNTTCIDIAALFTAVLAKVNLADIITFAHDAKEVDYNPDDSLFTISKQLSNAVGGGTNLASAFNLLKKEYDRIFILSDMQTWLETFWGSETANKAYHRYIKKFGLTNCKLYSFDLAGNGTLQFPENNVVCLAGFSEHVFDVLAKTEEDRNAMVHEIEAIDL